MTSPLHQTDAEFVRMLLWDEFPECCGSPIEDTGGAYMGQRETVMACCGKPEAAPLADAQIVASLRERFPEAAALTAALQQQGQEPRELEMHRADHKAVQEAGFHDAGELLAAYKYLATQENAARRKI